MNPLLTAMEANYPHRKHFLQTVNLPAFPPPGKSFLYMKTHKAACTTVLATLLQNLAELHDETFDISMDSVHTPPKTLLLTGPRGLSPKRVIAAVQDKEVFKFTIVREPISRTVSAWADKIAGGQKQKRRLMQHLGRPVEAELSLSEFLELIASDAALLDLDRHWRPQRKEISYDQIGFDFIGTMATIDRDMHHITEVIFADRALPKVTDTRQSLGHKTSSRELIEGLTAQDKRNLEYALGPDLDMYEEVQKRLAEAF